ncbi:MULTISPECIES: OmpA family protein [Pseudomonas]|jgi:outer membrane protein OmpA-like peptidoglycan-associated protein|uniref:OmpA family protein n=1 Tax=Pseudomonas soli TaxID=1306993 RepID=A0A1H9TAC1_9PSED|nr:MULTISPECIES: OmpA family protein [Pseudomonas]AUY36106.1 OmpA family protein [Pseudomonas sp. PONIH3]MCX5510193.1 OmpA family protein [Pseudomonas sp. BJa3]MDT3716441.1 OmpA family protein [Pseudomonas soli]MDT3732920.1 OmpA family protein [Pseudomonas soli]MEE1882087.1 OmpA family protein [Pseudomonas soli]
MRVLSKAALPLVVATSLLAGCATHSDGSAPLNQRTWPICSLLGGLVGGGLGAIESSSWAAGAGVAGAIAGGLICYAQDGDEDGDGVFDRRDRCPDTPAGTQVNHMGCPLPQYPATAPQPEPAATPEVITLDDQGQVLFAFDSAELTQGAQQRLQGLLPKLNDPSVASVKVIGFTDSVGSDSYNQRLSERRASGVAEYLISQGLAPNKVTSQGRGESEPVADNDTDEGRSRNRRVELHLN